MQNIFRMEVSVMSGREVQTPFLIVNPKSYLYGKKSLELARSADRTAAETGR